MLWKGALQEVFTAHKNSKSSFGLKIIYLSVSFGEGKAGRNFRIDTCAVVLGECYALLTCYAILFTRSHGGCVIKACDTNKTRWKSQKAARLKYMNESLTFYIYILSVLYIYYVIHGRVTPFFVNNSLTECRITMEFFTQFLLKLWSNF